MNIYDYTLIRYFALFLLVLFALFAIFASVGCVARIVPPSGMAQARADAIDAKCDRVFDRKLRNPSAGLFLLTGMDGTLQAVGARNQCLIDHGFKVER